MTDTERLDKLQALGGFDVVWAAESKRLPVGIVLVDGTGYWGANLRECIDSLPAAESEVQR